VHHFELQIETFSGEGAIYGPSPDPSSSEEQDTPPNQTSVDLLVEYHANGGGSWHANRLIPGQLSFEGSWILLLNDNSRKLVPITDCSDSKRIVQPSRRCPYCPEFVSVICSGPRKEVRLQVMLEGGWLQ